MNFTEMKREAGKIARKHRKALLRSGCGFVTGEAPLLAFDDDGRLEGKAHISHAYGDSGYTISDLNREELRKAIDEVKHEVYINPKLDPRTVGISLYGSYDGYESIHAYKNDEYWIDRITYDITIWTLAEGIVCREDE